MPEAPECRLTTDYLKSKLENKAISNWVFTSGQYEHKLPEGFEQFEDKLPFIVEDVQCKGKFIYFTLFNEDGYFYILHSLRMTGRWQDYEDEQCRWYIELDTNEKLWFRNPRCLATLTFTCKKDVLQKTLDNLGPDILTDDFKLPEWMKIIEKHKNKNITSFLMDQSIVSGIGNYIKAEVLYYAKISPLRKTGSLSVSEAEKLFEGIRIVSRVSYNKNGLSIRDYATSTGEKGEYSTELKVYGNPKARKLKTSDGRITHWDPNVQV